MADGDDALRATEARRLDLISEIGKKRNAAVIAYLTTVRRGVGDEASIKSDDTPVIEQHVRAARQAGARNIDLFLMTEGGHAVVPWDLVAMVREYFPRGQFRVLLPTVAYSAGALICLGADEIAMGMGSVLGPVDLQFPWWNGVGPGRYITSSDFQAILDLIAEQKISPQLARTKLMDWMTANADPAAVGALYRLWKEDSRIVHNLLGSRQPPLSRSQNERIAKFMTHGVGMHGQSIRRTEARAQGISFIVDMERTGIEAQCDALFAVYADVLRLRLPHARTSQTMQKVQQAGDEEDFDAEGRHLSQTPVAIVESLTDTNPAYVAYDLRHWNKVPPIAPAAPAEREHINRESFASAPQGRRSLHQAQFVTTRPAKR